MSLTLTQMQAIAALEKLGCQVMIVAQDAYVTYQATHFEIVQNIAEHLSPLVVKLYLLPTPSPAAQNSTPDSSSTNAGTATTVSKPEGAMAKPETSGGKIPVFDNPAALWKSPLPDTSRESHVRAPDTGDVGHD